MSKRICGNAFIILLVSALAIPSFHGRANAGDAGAFAAGAVIGGVIGAIAGSASKNRGGKKTYRSGKRRTSGTSSAQREENKSIQKALNLLGYNVGKVDGSLGKKSRSGIQQFQAARDFSATGQLTDIEKKLLLNSPLLIEVALHKIGFDVGIVDGKIDQQTAIAVAQLQGQIGQTPTGTLTVNQADMLLKQQVPLTAPPVVVAVAPSVPEQPPAPPAPEPLVAATWPVIESSNFVKGKMRNDNAVAVIIGNKDYTSKDIPSVEFAARDAQAMKYTFMNTLGVAEENIIVIENATLSSLVDTFGDSTPDGGLLWSYIDPDGESDVYVYYSGHGIPSLNNKGGKAEAYIAPTDVVSTSSIQSSYSLKKLYSNLEALPTKSVTLFIDACFSGAAGNGDMIIQAASPIVIPAYAPEESGKLNVFAAAQADQIASWDQVNGHGIFTQHLVKGLSGRADSDDDSFVSTGELEFYLAKQVNRTARRTWRRDQTPTFEGDQEQVLVAY